MPEPTPGRNGGAGQSERNPRREFLKGIGAASGAASLAWALAACTPRPVGAARTEAPSETPTFTPTQIIEAAVTLPAPTATTAVRTTASPTHAPDIRPATAPTAETVDLVEPKEITDAAEALPGVGGPTEGAFLEPGWVHEMQQRVAAGKATSSDWVMDGIYRLSLYAKQTGKPVRVGNGMAGFAASISKGKELKLTNYPGSSGQEIDKVKSADAANASVTIFAQTSADGQIYYLAEVAQKVGSATKVELAWLNGADVAVVLSQNAVVGKLNSQAVMAVHNTLKDVEKAKAVVVHADGAVGPDIRVEGLGTVNGPNPAEVESAISSYAKAMGLKAEAVKPAYKAIKGINGEQHIVAVTADNTPLMIATAIEGGEWLWQEASLRNIGQLGRVDVGISVDGSERYTDMGYEEAVKDNMSLIMPDGSFAANTMSRLGAGMATEFSNWAAESSMRLRILSAFHVDEASSWGEVKTREQADAFMRKRLDSLMDPKYVRPGSRTELVVVHEATVQDWGDGKEHWLGEGADKGLVRNPLFDVYGKEWPVKAYQLAYQIAAEKGIKVGEDVVFAFSDYDFLQNPAKANMVKSLMTRIRQGVAATAKLKPDQIRINLLDESHMHADKENKRGWKGIYSRDIRPQVIAGIAKMLSAFGEVEMSEIDVSGTADWQEKTAALTALTVAGLQSGIRSFDYYQALRFDSSKPENLSLFERDYSRTVSYWKLLQALFDFAT